MCDLGKWVSRASKSSATVSPSLCVRTVPALLNHRTCRFMDNATIAAIATPPGEGGIGVVRISGSEAAAIGGRIFQQSGKKTCPDLLNSESHRLFYGRIIDERQDSI